MKFTILGYKQEKLNKYDLKLEDALILNVLESMYVSNSKKIQYCVREKDKYMWVTYGYIFKQIPIIGSERTLKRRIEELIEKGIIKKIVEHQKNGVKGTYVWFGFGENFAELKDIEYETDDVLKEKEITSIEIQEVKMALKGREIDPVTVLRITRDMEEIKKIIAFAIKNGKENPWIITVLKDKKPFVGYKTKEMVIQEKEDKTIDFMVDNMVQ